MRVCEGKERDKEKEKVGLGGTSGWWETDKALKRMFPGVLGKAGHDTLESYLRVFRACRTHTHTHTHTLCVSGVVGECQTGLCSWEERSQEV